MKKILLYFLLLLISEWLFSQVPEGFKYQAVARDATGNLLSNKTVSLKISILSGTESGSEVYSEVHKDTTNTFGLVDFVIGRGTNKTGTFESINWGANKYFIKVEIDPAGGATYTLVGVSQLMSVPYSLHAKTVEIDNINDADADPLNEIQSLNLNGNTLTLSKNGGSVTLPASTGGTGGDNWGTQYVNSDATLTGKGTATEPLKIAQQSATTGKFLKWNGTTWAPGDEADGDATNEIQTISKTGNTVTLSRNGGSFTDAVDDADADATNEIQTISLNGNILILSKNGGSVTLPTTGSSTAGDNWGTQYTSTDASLEGKGTPEEPLKIAQQSAINGQVLKWDGSSWKPGVDDTGGGGGGLTLPFSSEYSLSTTPFDITSTGTSLYTIRGSSNSGCGIYGDTYAFNMAGVVGRGSGNGFSLGIFGSTGEGEYTLTPGNCGILGEANANIGVAGTAISGTGGFFSSSSGLALHTSGNLQLTGISEGEGKVLTSDASGNATWQVPSGSSGGLTLPFQRTNSYSTTPFSIENTGEAEYNISGINHSGFGIYGETRSPYYSGVLGKGTGGNGTCGVMGITGESSLSGTPGNCGVAGRSDNNFGVAGTSVSGTGGYFSSSAGLALHTFGNLRLTGINESEGKVLTSDAQGNATWQTPTGSGGGLTLPFSQNINDTNPAFLITNTGGHAIQGQSSASNGIGISGESTGANGYGVQGSGISIGVRGVALGSTDLNYGLMGISYSYQGYGIYGSSPYIGIYGTTSGLGWSGYFVGKTFVSDKLGIGVLDPGSQLDVAGAINTNNGISEGIALTCNGVEAIWSNGTYFSWGFGASSHNYFDKPITIGGFLTPDTYMLSVNGTAAKTDGASWSVLSDARMKNISGNYSKGLKEIVALQPVTFTYKEGNSRKLDSSKPQIGFVAQEVQKIFPEAVNLCSDGYLDFNMHAVNVALVNAVKELESENKTLKEKNTEIEVRLTKLEKLLQTSASK